MSEQVFAVVKTIPYFSGISDQILEELTNRAVVKHFSKHTIIISEGDESGPLFVILTGKVRVFLCDAHGKEVTLSEQKAVTYFGELSLLDHEHRSASVMTLEPTTCALIPKPAFIHWVTKYPAEAGLALIQGLTKRVRVLTENVKSLALSDVYGRLVKVLHEKAEPIDGLHEQWQITESISHQELANLVGSSREMVSRILKDLVEGEYIRKDGKTLKILKRLPAAW